MPRFRCTVIWLSAMGSVWLIACAAIGVVAIEGALHPARRPIAPIDRTRSHAVARADAATLRDVNIRARDGVSLRAWYLRPNVGSTDAVILLHGQADNRAGMLANADLLLRHGYAVLLPDARAHGESNGAFASYGVLETDDLERWYAWLRQEDHPRCIDARGDSMGGAQVLESLMLVRSYCAVVAESSFATFREAAYDRLGQQFGTGQWLGRTLLRSAVEFGLLYARTRYGVNMAQASPLRAARQSSTPVLLIHGLADINLPPRHSELIANADSEAQLWEPRTAGHCGASSAEPRMYENKVISWFAEHSGER